MTVTLPPKPQSLREYVEAYLKQAIVGGKYKPGDRLIEREICELLGVSRPPVREALRQLEADKLITHELHRGPVVASVSSVAVSIAGVSSTESEVSSVVSSSKNIVSSPIYAMHRC